MKKLPKIGLALGGGGARGLAHIGVIRAFREAQIPIDYIAGTSMGAIVGGWYAATQDLEMIEENFLKFRKRDIFPKRTILRHGDGVLFRDNAAIEFLEHKIIRKKIEDCPIPFAAVATEVANGDVAVLKKGNLVHAIRASSAIPVMFHPVKIGDTLFMDGGFSNPVPADVVREMGAEFVIAVDVSSRWIDFSDSQVRVRNLASIVANSFSAVEYQLSKDILKHADIIIRPPVLNYDLLRFDAAGEIIPLGAREAWRAVKEIREKTGHEGPPKTFVENLVDFLFDGE